MDGTVSILYVNHLTNLGGSETSLIDIIDNIDKTKYTINVACPGSGDLVEALKKRDAEHLIIRTDVLRRTANPLLLITFAYYFVISTAKLIHIIKSRKVRIIHANSFTACLFCSISAKICGIPLIWHMRDLVKSRLFNKVFITYAGWTANIIVATTYIMKSRLSALGVKQGKIVVIHNGIDVKKFDTIYIDAPKIREKFDIRADCPLIGIVGQVVDWKGHREFLKAASIVCKEYASAKFLIVGKNIKGNKEYEQELRNYVARLNLQENVVFTGFREDIPAVISSLDILVNASWIETFGRTIIEGMCAGKPVIATNAGGVPEIIEDGINGILVPPKDARELAAGILKVLNDPKLGRKIGDAGRKTVRQKFSLERQMRKIEKVYENVLC